jgi:hypothetical protein
MSDYTDADVQAAAKSLAEARWMGFVAAQRRESVTEPNERYARAVLDAVAPAIAARAKVEVLREAAEVAATLVTQNGRDIALYLRDFADEIEQGQS